MPRTALRPNSGGEGVLESIPATLYSTPEIPSFVFTTRLRAKRGPPPVSREGGMYSCGPTVYHHLHTQLPDVLVERSPSALSAVPRACA